MQRDIRSKVEKIHKYKNSVDNRRVEEQLRVYRAESTECSFKPEISNKSRKILKGKKQEFEDLPACERLYRMSQKTEQLNDPRIPVQSRSPAPKRPPRRTKSRRNSNLRSSCASKIGVRTTKSPIPNKHLDKENMRQSINLQKTICKEIEFEEEEDSEQDIVGNCIGKLVFASKTPLTFKNQKNTKIEADKKISPPQGRKFIEVHGQKIYFDEFVVEEVLNLGLRRKLGVN